MIIIQLIVFLAFVFVGLVVFLQKLLKSDAQGAIKRMDEIYQDLLNKQKDLTGKIEAAEKEYQEKKEAAIHVVDKMKSDAMDEIRDKKDEIVKQARAQADEILGKARASSDEFYRKIELELQRKFIDTAASLLMTALPVKVLGNLHRDIVAEFLERGKNFDLSSVPAQLDKVIVKSAIPLGKETLDQLNSIIRVKLNRVLKIEEIEDKSIGAGVLLQFDTLLLDGSLANMLRETSEKTKKEIEFQK